MDNKIKSCYANVILFIKKKTFSKLIVDKL